jgi:hypothetical protein
VWKTALVTLLCLGLLSACEDSTPTEPKAAATPGRPSSLVQDLAWAPVVLADRCPPIHQRLLFPPGGTLPKGANVVRLCNGRSTPGLGPGYRYDVPADVLTSDIDSLIEQVNGLEPPRPPPSGQRVYCADDGGTAINFWFGYPDGTAAAVSWQPFGCRLLRIAPDQAVNGGRDLLSAYAKALASQRASSHFLAMPAAPHCSPGVQPTSPLGAASLGTLANVTYCVSVPHRGWREAKVPRRLIRRINDEAVAGHRGHGCPERRAPWLRATTTSGDEVVFYPAIHCAWTLPVLPDTPERYPSWRPSKKLAHALKRLPLQEVRR